MNVDSITDIGLVRSQNEDDVKVGLLPDGAWAVVCDGMGGANAGEVASHQGVEVISKAICQNYSEGASANTVKYLLHDAIWEANSVIYQMAEENPEMAGMGTTVVAAVAAQGTIHLCHDGDSRAYLIKGDKITQLTKDHSIVQQLVDAGTLTPEEAKVHPQKNIITRCLGVREGIEIEYGEYPAEAGDLLLLCTDGLTGYVDAPEILEDAQQMEPSALIRSLVEKAKQRGGNDNITAAMIAI
jgi:protein phosphatase